MSASAAPQLQATARSQAFKRRTDRVAVGWALVDPYSFAGACSALIAHAIADGAPAYAITPNAQHVMLLEKDAALRTIYRQADVVVPDGVSLLLAARLYGRYFPERVPGVELFQHLCAQAAQNNLKVFLLGGRPGSAEQAAAVLKSRFPGLQTDTFCPPLGFESDPIELGRIAAAVGEARPALLFAALGAPKQERWIYEHGLQLGVPVSMGVGGSFEMVAGVLQRAPGWVQSLGCEWLYRLCLEPRRMWKRYLFGNAQFLWVVLKQQARRSTLNLFCSWMEKEPFAAELEEPVFRGSLLALSDRLSAAVTHPHPSAVPNSPVISSSKKKEVLPL